MQNSTVIQSHKTIITNYYHLFIPLVYTMEFAILTRKTLRPYRNTEVRLKDELQSLRNINHVPSRKKQTMILLAKWRPVIHKLLPNTMRKRYFIKDAKLSSTTQVSQTVIPIRALIIRALHIITNLVTGRLTSTYFSSVRVPSRSKEERHL